MMMLVRQGRLEDSADVDVQKQPFGMSVPSFVQPEVPQYISEQFNFSDMKDVCSWYWINPGNVCCFVLLFFFCILICFYCLFPKKIFFFTLSLYDEVHYKMCEIDIVFGGCWLVLQWTDLIGLERLMAAARSSLLHG